MKSEREIDHKSSGRDVDNRSIEEQCEFWKARSEMLAERVRELEQEKAEWKERHENSGR